MMDAVCCRQPTTSPSKVDVDYYDIYRIFKCIVNREDKDSEKYSLLCIYGHLCFVLSKDESIFLSL